jgi:hypothetical protein
MTRSTSISKKAAESLAIQVLAFIASDAERIGPFLAATGIGPEDIRAAARDPEFLAGVLDYTCEDEPLLIAFATETGGNPFDVPMARDALRGPRRGND